MLYNVLFSVLIIALGLLVKRFPMLIAGYNTMPKAMKAKVDIDELSSMMKRVMMLTGAALLALALILDLIQQNNYFASIGGVFVVLMAVVIIIKGQKYDHNDAKGRKGYYLSVISLSLIIILLVHLFGKREIQLELGDQAIQIEAAYDTNIPYANITEVILSDSLPTIQMRTNGYAFMGTLVGNFRVSKWGKCKLFIEESKPPYLVIFQKEGPTTVVALKQEGETANLYTEIENLLLTLQKVK